jgi:hypothetical protein
MKPKLTLHWTFIERSYMKKLCISLRKTHCDKKGELWNPRVKTQLETKFVVKTQLFLTKICTTCQEKCVRPIYTPHIQRRILWVCARVRVFHAHERVIVVGHLHCRAVTPPTASSVHVKSPFPSMDRPVISLVPPLREAAGIRHENSKWSGACITYWCRRTPIRVTVRPSWICQILEWKVMKR